MRMATFTAATLDDAMTRVRAALGREAVVLSWRHVKGGVELTASAPGPVDPPAAGSRPPGPAATRKHEAAGPEWDAFFAKANAGKPAPATPAPAPVTPPSAPGASALVRPAATPVATPAAKPAPQKPAAQKPAAAPAPSPLARVLHKAGLDKPSALVWARAGERDRGATLHQALTAALTDRLRVAPVDAVPREPIALVGPPGAGKTATAAKLAARALSTGAPVLIIGADTVRAGGVAQARELARRLGAGFERVETVNEAARHIRQARAEGAVCLLDCPAAGPFDPADMRQTERFSLETGCEPILCLPGDGRPDDLTDLAAAFAAIGVRRAIATRLDLTARRAGVLAALSPDGLALAHLSTTPFIAGGLALAGAARMASIILEPFDAMDLRQAQAGHAA
jgi:flagellar biosynthesis protein FlhF